MIEDTRLTVRRMFEDRVTGADEFKLPEIADEIVAALRADEALVQAFLEQHLRPLVYAVGQHTLAAWRRAKEDDGQPVVTVGTTALTRRALERRSFARRMDWLRHYEQAGDRQVRVMAMTRRDCLLAAEGRTKRIETESQYVRFLKTLAKNLTDAERVADKFRPEQLQQIFDQCAVGRKRKPGDSAPDAKTA